MYEWTKNKSSTSSSINSKWIEEFELKSHISETIINKIGNKITLEEIENALSNLATKKSPGPLEITNEMLKQLGPQAKNQLLLLLNKVISTGKMPKNWITSYVSLLLKPRDWEGSLNLVLPITLMKTS